MGVSQVNHTTTATKGLAPQQPAASSQPRAAWIGRGGWVAATAAYNRRRPDIPGSGPRRMPESPVSIYLLAVAEPANPEQACNFLGT